MLTTTGIERPGTTTGSLGLAGLVNRFRWRWPHLLAIWAVVAVLVFRRQFFSGFNVLSGDIGDSKLIAYLHEHWVQVIMGKAAWRDPAFFYPTTGVSGYSDTFVLDEVFYAPLRAIGMDMFLAYQWTLILSTLLGFLGMFYLCRRIVGPHPVFASLLALTFAFSNTLTVQIVHSQLFAIEWIPLLVLLVLRSAQAQRRTIGWSYAAAAGLLSGLLFLSTYYVAWFSALALGLWLLVYVLLALCSRPGRAGLSAALRRHVGRAVAFVVAFAVGLVPFVAIYLPILAGRGGGWPYSSVLGYAARPEDLVNLGPSNFLWTDALRAFFPDAYTKHSSEVAFGLTPVLLTLLVVALAWFGYRVVTTRARLSSEVVAFTTAAVGVMLLLLPVWTFYGLPWRLVWILVPGAQAIRAIDRIAVLAVFFGCLAVAFLLRAAFTPVLPTRTSRAWRMGVAVVVMAVLLLEQFNIATSNTLDRGQELAQLDAVPSPPAECKAFFVTVPALRAPPGFVTSIEAMLISDKVDLPTINGYSGYFPPGFGNLTSPGTKTYPQSVNTWLAAHHLTTGICSYDLATHLWTRHPA